MTGMTMANGQDVMKDGVKLDEVHEDVTNESRQALLVEDMDFEKLKKVVENEEK